MRGLGVWQEGVVGGQGGIGVGGEGGGQSCLSRPTLTPVSNTHVQHKGPVGSCYEALGKSNHVRCNCSPPTPLSAVNTHLQ